MARPVWLVLTVMVLCGIAANPAAAMAPDDGTAHATPDDIREQVDAMLAAMTPGQTFMWRPLLKAGAQTAALEIWKAPGRPAIHTAEAEYVLVVQGTGTLVTGGVLVNSHLVKPGFIDGDRIEGGISQTLVAGEVVLIPAGVPHSFEIPGEPLVLLGTKIPAASQP